MLSQDKIIGIGMTFLGIITMIWVVPDAAEELGGYEAAVGANVLPLASMAVFTGLAVLLTLFGGRHKTEKSESDSPMNVHAWSCLLLLTVMLFTFLAGLKYIGFIPSGIICIAAFMLVMGQRSILTILLTSTSLPIVSYFIIRQLLKIPLT